MRGMCEHWSTTEVRYSTDMNLPHLSAKGRVQRLCNIAAEGAHYLIAVLSSCNDGANNHDVLIVQPDVPVLCSRARAARGAARSRLGQPRDQLGGVGPQHALQVMREPSDRDAFTAPLAYMATTRKRLQVGGLVAVY